MSKNKKNLMFVFGGVLSLLWLFPFYVMLINSFKTKKELFTSVLAFPKTFTLTNYVKASQSLKFNITLFNSFVITICSVVIILVFSALAAYALQRTKSKASNIVFFVFISAMLIPFQSIMIPLVSLMNHIGLGGHRYGLIFEYLGFGSCMSIFLIHGALGSIPTSMDEAAEIDGCNPFQTFLMIILPMLKPILVTVSVLNIIWIWNDYLLPSLTISADNLQTIPIRMFYFFGEYTKQWNLAMAGLTIAIIPVIIFYLIAQKQIIQGITDGAVK